MNIIKFIVHYTTLTQESILNGISNKSTFWNNATKYAAVSKDEPFVEEVAYVMVTLHRTGA